MSLSDLLEILGAAVVAVGVGLIWFPAGVIAAGVLLIVFGYASANSTKGG